MDARPLHVMTKNDVARALNVVPPTVGPLRGPRLAKRQCHRQPENSISQPPPFHFHFRPGHASVSRAPPRSRMT